MSLLSVTLVDKTVVDGEEVLAHIPIITDKSLEDIVLELSVKWNIIEVVDNSGSFRKKVVNGILHDFESSDEVNKASEDEVISEDENNMSDKASDFLSSLSMG